MPDLLDRYFISQRFSFQGLSLAAGLAGLAYSVGGPWLTRLARALQCRSAVVDGQGTVASLRMLTLDHPRLKVFCIEGTPSVAEFRTYLFNDLTLPVPGTASFSASFFLDAADNIVTRIRAIPGGPFSVVLLGHSLGGAVASLAAPRLRDAGYNVYGVWSVGSPKPADERFARSYDIPHWRGVDSIDPIGYLPIQGVTLGNVISELGIAGALVRTPNWSQCGHPIVLDFHTYPADAEGQAEHIREFISWTQDRFHIRHGVERYMRLAVHHARDAYLLEMRAFDDVLRSENYNVRA